MSDIESRVRAAAMELHAAITAAHEAGYKVSFPHQVDDLPAIAVSETARVSKPTAAAVGRRAVPAPEPKTDA